MVFVNFYNINRSNGKLYGNINVILQIYTDISLSVGQKPIRTKALLSKNDFCPTCIFHGGAFVHHVIFRWRGICPEGLLPVSREKRINNLVLRKLIHMLCLFIL